MSIKKTILQTQLKLKIPTRMPINTNTKSRTERAARTSSLVLQSQKSKRKSALGRICAQIDDKLHRSHEGRGCFKPGTLTKIVEELKGEFPWITCDIIDKAYNKHAQSFVKASSLSLGGGEIKHTRHARHARHTGQSSIYATNYTSNST